MLQISFITRSIASLDILRRYKMSLIEKVDYEELKKLLEPADRILKSYDLVKLRRTNQYRSNPECFEQVYPG